MEITKEFLLREQAGYEQQRADKLQLLEKTRNDLEAIGGGLQVVAYLLKKLEEQPSTAEENTNKGEDNS